MNKEANRTYFESLYFLLSALLFIYLFLRAVYVPLVYDEAATFFIYVLPGEYIPFYAYWDANNHILNSFLGSCSYNLFGTAAWAIRLPNVLFFLFNVYFLYQFRFFFKNKTVWFAMALFLFFTHNVTEYSAYCRGYGMCISAFLGCIYYLLKFKQEQRNKYLWLLCLFTFLALAANFTVLNPVLIIYAFAVFFIFYFKAFNKQSLVFCTLNFLVLGLSIWIGFELKKRGTLYYGSQDGFYKVTLISISKLIAGTETSWVPFFFIGLTVLALMAVIFKWIITKEKNIISNNLFLLIVLFFGSIAAIFLLNLCLKINYPEDRTGLYLFPLFVLLVFFSIDNALRSKPAIIFSSALALLMVVHFFTQVNFAYSAFWKQERVPRSFYQTILDENVGKEHEVFISAYKIKTYVWNYYTFKNKVKLNEVYHEHFPSAHADYLIIEENNFEKYPKVVSHYKEVGRDSYNGIRLLKNNTPNNYRQIFDSTITEDKYINYSYVGLLNYKPSIDTIENIAVEFEGNLTCAGLTHIDFVFKASKDKETITEAVCRTQWQREKWINPDNKIKNRIFLENVSSADRYVLFINGREGESYKLSNLKIKIFSF